MSLLLGNCMRGWILEQGEPCGRAGGRATGRVLLPVLVGAAAERAALPRSDLVGRVVGQSLTRSASLAFTEQVRMPRSPAAPPRA